MEKFTTLKPSNPFLQNYIESFYFHDSKDVTSSSKVIFFPNTKNALTIYKNSELISYSNHLRVIKPSNVDYTILYGAIQKSYNICEIKPPFDKIGIIFKPLGINYFLNTNLSNNISKKNTYKFPFFHDNLRETLDKTYATNSARERVEHLQSFFLEAFNDKFAELTVINGIKLIEESKSKIKITQLADKLNVSEKTLTRKFKTHLNCTPKHYQKVYLFRRVIEEYVLTNGEKSLTYLTYENFFYDQSDLIKNFKSFTSNNPSKFFKEVKDMGNNIFWIK